VAVTYNILQQSEGTHHDTDFSDEAGATETVQSGLIFVDVLFTDDEKNQEYRHGFAAAVDSDGNYDEAGTFALCDAIVEKIANGIISLGS
jgi:hypothetical protein